MIRAIIASFVLVASPLSVAAEGDLAGIITQYEAFAKAGDADAEARAKGDRPRRWAGVTPETVAARAEEARKLLSALTDLNDSQTGSGPEAAILRNLLQAEIDAHRFDTARIPFVGDSGFFSWPHYAALGTRIVKPEHADAWIARLEDLPRYFADNTTNMRRGLQTGWTQHSDPLATSMDQIREQIVDTPEDSPLYLPFKSLPETISADEAEAIRARGRVAVEDALVAYRDVLRFLEVEYVPAARVQPGLVSLPGGREAYAAAVADHTAGSGYSPEDIHELGKTEVARIRAEMEAIIEDVAFEGSFAEFVAFLRTDPQFYARSADDLMEKAAEMSKRLDGILPQYFSVLPRLPYTVVPVPASIAPGYTTGRYSGGDMEGGVPGKYLVNTYRLNQRPLYELPALSAHEAVPGHHLQIALAQELTDVPDFRKSYYATAFGEGWGLYAEKLAGEAGFYRTPYERFGQLSYEMWRACRLVADTGLHHYGWTRAQAETCFNENTALAPLNIETEVTRYIGWPGQATAYKVGELKILALRARAKTALGDRFDIRKFHDHLLGAGAMPMDALDARMQAWESAQAAE